MKPEQPRQQKPQPKVTFSATERAHLLREVRSLQGALLQKVWLQSAALLVLQLRVPGKNVLVVLDARTGLLGIAPERPQAAEAAPRSQATLRAALSGARLEGARLEVAGSATADEQRKPSARVWFSSPNGPRALLAQAGALLLLGAGEKIVWASGGEARPGTVHPAAREVPLEELQEGPQPEDAQVMARALLQEAQQGLAARRRALEARLAARVKKLERTQAAVEADQARAAQAERDLHRAALLLPHQGRVQRGAREVTVPDWSQLDEEGQAAQVALALDPALSAAANAARWLKRGKRYQAAQGRIAARLAEVGRALEASLALLARAGQIHDAASLRAVEDLAGALPAQPGQGKGRGREAERVPYRTFRSTAGARILVGRSARDNDALTLRIARGNDLWLHARGLTGSHVIVPLEGAQAEPDPRTLIDAALLALHFSSAREAEFAEVAWTRRKYVRKPKGAAPGAVTFSQEKTVRVRREPERLQQLFAQEEKDAAP